MTGIFKLLQSNRGTVSSALGKELAIKALKGDAGILEEAIGLSTYDIENEDSKNIRSGAAKIVEIVAEKNPELICQHLGKLMSALNAREPQTRWMIIRTMGFCCHLDKKTAKLAIPYAEKYIRKKEGLCIASSADLFLGDFGALSRKDAIIVFPLLELTISNHVLNEQDWILEAFIKMSHNLETDDWKKVISFAKRWEHSGRKATVVRVNKLMKLI